ncbi:MAG: amino acid permease [Verrucomicrobiae bacterium]|nr:amino acid permease [Verrucomicrobiae bacterium]
MAEGRERMSNKRQLGLVSATALVVANMIGMGVFTTSGYTLGDLKSPWLVLAAWAVGGVIAAMGALCYAALARRIPESGGEYLFLSRTLHPAAGYVAGWISLLVGFSAPLAAVAYGFGEYAKTWYPGWDAQTVGAVLIILFAALHAADVKHGAWVQNATVILKIILILGFIGWGFAHLPEPRPYAPPKFPLGLFAVCLVWISFSYSGWNAVIYIGGEVKDGERILPRAMLLGTGIVTVLYLLLNAVFVFAAPMEQLQYQVAIGWVAARALGGDLWANFITALVSLALISSASSLLMVGPRVYAKMAEDGWLPRWLAAESGPPRRAIGLQAVLALFLLWHTEFQNLMNYIGFTLLLSTTATVLGLIRLRLREGAAVRVVGWPWLPFLYLGVVYAMALFNVQLRPTQSLYGLGTIFLGVVAWWLTARYRRRPPATRAVT